MARAKHRHKAETAQLKKFIKAVERQHQHEVTFGASPFPKPKKKRRGKVAATKK